MPDRAVHVHVLSLLLALAGGIGEFVSLQAWRVRDRLARRQGWNETA